MEINLIEEAFKFMALGMGIVFLFLVVMIYALKLQAKLIGKYFPEKKIAPAKSTVKVSDNTAKMAAIVAAVQHHKNLKG
ncbi:MAG: sodium pump decarboxylase subunit gamma [Arcobacter sp.]|nr:MAG: sodium pump decarboxylase subunit gamma [Arcobacter sp.]